ncbi:MAG: transglycosylase domain-containing protein [Clostridia bacterium]
MPSNNGRNKSNRNNSDKARPRKVQNGKRRKAKSTENNRATRRPEVKKSKKAQDKNKHPKLKMAIKIFLVLFLLLCVIGAGIVAGMFFGLFGDDFEITKEELKIGASNSVIVDSNGTVIANLSGDEKRKVITLEDMADYLPKAYVAIEDERFYKHNGVDFKRTAGAILHTVTGNSSYGGSTITQQLVKNITKDDESSGLAGIMRKVKEWAKAYQVERMISKDQILELYLNILYVGGEGNLHGVELGAQYYFNKSAKDLSLAECAFLAGINSSPNYYNPYKLASDTDTEEKRDERIKSKVLTVLSKMKELGYIENEEDYNKAVEETNAGLKFEKGEIATGSNYSYHTDAVIEQVITQVMEEKNISRQLAENYVYSSGLTIYSTVDSTIQARLEEEYAKEKYQITSPTKAQTSQSGMAVIDYKTGNVVGVAGGLGEKNGAGWNRATQMKKQTGSSIKPIADVAPALEEGVITAATVYMDEKTDFGNNYKPKNDGNAYKNAGMNIREFIALSRNIPALKIMKELTPSKSLEYLKNMGLSSLDDKADNVLALAIGGMTNGASPLEMAAAYGTIANDGVYITPTFYTKVVDSNGNTVLTPKQEQKRVFSEQTAYITKSITKEPVTASNGTATYCKIPGMDVAAKTGTTDNSYDRWLCGFTPYYAAATWFGYDNSEEVKYTGNPAGQIWAAVMKDIHKELANASFQRPSGIVEQTICRTTGCLATTGCTDTYKEIFSSNNLPEKCQGHGTQTICTESGKIANEYCPSTEVNNYGATIPKEQLKLWTPVNGKNNASGTKIEETCDIHKKPEEKPKEPEKPENNTTNTNTNTSENTNTSVNTNTNGNTNTSGNTNTGGTEEPEAGT